MLPTRKGFAQGKQKDRLPEGQDERPSVDWMDFEEADGGDERNAVHLGKRKIESERD